MFLLAQHGLFLTVPNGVQKTIQEHNNKNRDALIFLPALRQLSSDLGDVALSSSNF